MKLGDYLRALKNWNCTTFVRECAERNYAFSQYTSLMYDRFCSPVHFEKSCESKLLPYTRNETLANYWIVADEGSGHDRSEVTSNLRTGWSEALHVDSLKRGMTQEDQMEPCVQAALVNINNFSSGRYFETKQHEMAFCDISWCAFTTEVFKTKHISDSVCMPEK